MLPVVVPVVMMVSITIVPRIVAVVATLAAAASGAAVVVMARTVVAPMFRVMLAHGAPVSGASVLPPAHLLTAHAAVPDGRPHSVAVAHAATPLRKREGRSNCNQEQS